MKSVFVLQHVHTLPSGEEDIKLVGVYSSEVLALKAVTRVASQLGFRDDPVVVDPDGDESDGFHISNVCNRRGSLDGRICDCMRFNRFVEWTHNGGQRGRHSSMLTAPLLPIHGRR